MTRRTFEALCMMEALNRPKALCRSEALYKSMALRKSLVGTGTRRSTGIPSTMGTIPAVMESLEQWTREAETLVPASPRLCSDKEASCA